MAQFYFDVCTDGVTVEDERGLDLLSAATARLEAARAAAELMRDRCVAKAKPADVSIIVRDRRPEPVCTVQVAFKVRSLGWAAAHSS
jgi:hypothetical protein